MEQYDFAGWATKNDIRCADGRTIRKGAFKDCDGVVVPLVWNHQHNDGFNVLGHALLQNRDEGTYAYCSFNDTESGKNAKELVNHGDIVSLSIYANQLKEKDGNVFHGMIREVSLVLAGANPGAYIDAISHSEELDESDGIIYSGTEGLELSHACGGSADESKKKKELEHSKEENVEKEPAKMENQENQGGKTVKEVFDSMTEEQKTVVYAMIGEALEQAKQGNAAQHSAIDEGEDVMKHNVFDQGTPENVLTHDEMTAIVADAKRCGSMKEAVIAHGIDSIDYLFPDARNVTDTPEFIKREDEWVGKVMNGCSHTPFSRIKSLFANITEADARARGYVKGKYKVEEVFGLLKRTTTATTIYKKQKLERDDVIEITDFDVVAWLKTEMRGMLNEEIARAILVGDGRNSASDDKINEQNIRPIWTDDDLYTIKKTVALASSATDDQKAKAFIRAAVKARTEYKGSGNPVAFMTEDLLTDCLLIDDGIGHRLYKNADEVAQAMRVSSIVTVPVMENLTREVGNDTHYLMGIIVNLKDYNVGADKGGSVNMFDDFDIDYNAMKYLIETRCSGALIKPYSAIAIEASYAVQLSVAPVAGTETVLGKTVSDLQTNVIVNDDFIQGTLKYVTNYTGYSQDPTENFGNFLALSFEHLTGSTTQIKLDGSPIAGWSTLDSDMKAVLRITNKDTQKLHVKTTKDGVTLEKTYSLSAMRCLNA